MASIPCATYQAGHIHAQMRREEMRRRHSSTASTDSSTSDSLIQEPTQLQTSSIQPVSNTRTMDRVSQWVGTHMKKIRFPVQADSLGRVPENNLSTVTIDTQSTMMAKPEL